MHGQLGVKGISIDQCHGVRGMSTGEVNHQDAIVHSRVRSMSTHHGMGHSIRAVEMVQCFSTPFAARNAIHGHTFRCVILVQELSGQTLALAIGHKEGLQPYKLQGLFPIKIQWSLGFQVFTCFLSTFSVIV